VVAVVCQPDRPRGRGLEVVAPETKRVAERHGIPVLQPARMRDPAFQDALRALAPDLAVVAAYGRILPRELLDLPVHGCINVHASLLPRHRGAAPVHWAILSGDSETGVTIMRMTEELDAGDMLATRALPIRPEHTAGTLTAELAELGAAALVDTVDRLKAGKATATPQPAEGVTFAPRIERGQGRLDWTADAATLERLVRGLAPSPSAFTSVATKRLKVHRAVVEHAESGRPPGTVIEAGASGIAVQTGRGVLRLLEVQLEGRNAMPAAAFVAGSRLEAGSCLGGG
jgi:methionyl-tRNA formyltransferase